MKALREPNLFVQGAEVPEFAYRGVPNYWHAVIGPVHRDRLDVEYPQGEGALRWALEEQFAKMFPDIHFTCSSGWGMTEQQKDDVAIATYNDPTKKRLIQSYYDEGKPMPRALKAWELLFEEEHRQRVRSNKLIK